jgi:hypothetical protein
MLRVVTSVSAILLAIPIGHAQDCPTEQTAKRGFVVERGALQKTEVFTGDDGTVRTSMRYRGQSLLETTLFAGLFSLNRLDRGHRLTYTPLTDLKKLFPLKVGQKALALFEYSKDGKTMPLTVVLSVKSSEPLAIPTRSSNLSAPKATARVLHRDTSTPNTIRPTSNLY